MRATAIMAILLLQACSAETRHFRGVEPVQTHVDGSVFDVRVRGNLAEAIRTNPQYAPRLGPLRAQAGFAMAQVSGCVVTGVLGDQVVLTGVLDCEVRAKAPVSKSYACVEVSEWVRAQTVIAYPRYDCPKTTTLQ